MLIPSHSSWLIALVPGFSHNEALPGAKILLGFVILWLPQLLFFIAGAGSRLALEFRSAREYVKERVKRLLIPLVFGVLVVLPPMLYYWPSSPKRSYGHFLAFLYRDFPSVFYNGGNLSWRHLWFIFYLFVFSLMALPLFLYLRRGSGHRVTSKLAAFLGKRGAIFLLGIPLAIIQATLAVKWPSIFVVGGYCIYNDMARFVFYITIFIYGYLVCSDEKLWRAIERHRRISLLLAAVCMLLMIAASIRSRELAARVRGLSTAGQTPGYMMYMALGGFNSWLWLLAFLGLGRKHLNSGSKVLEYAREASYPFYISHETLMVVIGFYLVKLRTPAIVEFFVLGITTFLATMALYDLLIRRTNVTRFLFGMRLKKREVTSSQHSAEKGG